MLIEIQYSESGARLLDVHATATLVILTLWFVIIQSFHMIRIGAWMMLLQVLSADATQEVGKITKQWSGLAKEYFTDADNFGIQCELKL